jgi:pSer/pThr/pTyr-binding forkhead associated (FHA) protein
VKEKDQYGGSKGAVKFVFYYYFFFLAMMPTSFIRPFIIDLESTNGTIVNDETIPVSRFYELKAGDGKRMQYCG